MKILTRIAADEEHITRDVHFRISPASEFLAERGIAFLSDLDLLLILKAAAK